METRPATWSNISNASKDSPEVKIASIPPAKINVSVDTDRLVETIEEGFKRHTMEAACEIVDALESLENSVQEAIQCFGVASAESGERSERMIEAIRLYKVLGLDLFSAAKEMKISLDEIPDAIKAIKMDANIPITNLTVGLPKGVLLYALLSPAIFALGALLIGKLF